MDYKWKISEVRGDEKLEVASGGGVDKEAVEKECKHYSMMYKK